MPLTEISANVRRNGSHMPKPSQAPCQGQSPNKVKPDVVSTMLRTTTETGDIGQFSVRPSRLPLTASRLPARSRTASLIAPPASTRRPAPRHDSQRLPRPVPSFSVLSRHDTVRSSPTTYHSNHRARRGGAPRISYSSNRRPSTAAPSGLDGPPPFLTLRSRPENRAASPAFSEAQSMPPYSRNLGFHRAASVATATSSPSSTLKRDVTYGYREANMSTSSMSRISSPGVPGTYRATRRSPFQSRNNTPVSASLHNSIRLPYGSLESLQTTQRSTRSITPLYYDYSEAFAEESCQLPPPNIQISSLFSADHTIPEQEPAWSARQAQTSPDMVPSSIFEPGEMTTKHCRTHSERSQQNMHDDNMIQKTLSKEGKETPKYDCDKARVSIERLPSRSSEDQHLEMDLCQSSAFSRRTYSTSPSLSFFPVTNRVIEEQENVPTCAYLPPGNRASIKDVKTTDEIGGPGGSPNYPVGRDEYVDTDWQLPSLEFRPLSFVKCSQEAAERPRSSGLSKGVDPPTIISPTPERPMSSQSRRMFNKILDLDENLCSPAHGRRHQSGSYSSLNAGKLRRVLATAKVHYPARYNIPPFSPRNSLIAESTRDNESNIESADSEHESECEKSAVELLLDKHIEGLGLRPESMSKPIEYRERLTDDGKQASIISTSRDESTNRMAEEPSTTHRSRAETVNKISISTTGSPEQLALLPRKLFCPDAPRTQKLAVAQSSPCMAEVSFQDSSVRSSTGWNTIASMSHIVSNEPSLNELTKKRFPPTDGRASSRFGTQQLSLRRRSPSTSICGSGDSEDLYNWTDNIFLSERSRQRSLERQLSQRRRMKVKLKNASHGRRRILPNEFSFTGESLCTAQLPSINQFSILEPSCEQNTIVMGIHDPVNVENDSGDAAEEDLMQEAAKNEATSTSLNMPSPRSTVPACARTRIKQGADMARKVSARSVRSHHSNDSIAEPPNSTVLSAIAPHLGTPDLGPPLTHMSLNMDFKFPPIGVAEPQGLRATKSFFSDDSSASRNPRSSLRKKFYLPSLRGVLSFPRGHPVTHVAGENRDAAQPRLHHYHSSRMQGLNEEDEECDDYGTVAMSDFAYCRRKMVERFKNWWKRHGRQRRVALRRRNGERDPVQCHWSA